MNFGNRFHPSQGWNLSVRPNPFSSTTSISFSIPKDETVNLIIYDLLGQEIKNITATYPAGQHIVEWNGDNEQGEPVSSGLYLLRLSSGEHREEEKVILIR